MNFPNPKELQKLAMACRKAGIKSFKCAEFEFSLTDDLPEPRKKAEASRTGGLKVDDVTTAGLTEEELLFWSANTQAEGA